MSESQLYWEDSIFVGERSLTCYGYGRSRYFAVVTPDATFVRATATIKNMHDDKWRVSIKAESIAKAKYWAENMLYILKGQEVD